ncbi:MAG: polysulfide reductase NrfD [Bacteroidales bacterium]|nr:polysulfide reductase NrfD [Bacteroidales bacterium]
MPVTVKISTIIPPFIIAIGLIFLIEDLHHKLYFWQLMVHFEVASPMSWGTWILTIILFISILWPLSFIDGIKLFFEENNKKRLAKWCGSVQNVMKKVPLLPKLVELTTKNRKTLAYITFFLAIALGIYTGILLSSFNARPLWNTSILGPLFLVSGVSTGAAAIMWLSNNKEEKALFSRIDLVLIGIELTLIFLMFLGMAWGPEVYQQTAAMFLGGEFTAVFWGVFVGMGLILPAILEALELKGFHVPIAIPAFLILLGGLIFRVIMVVAGQISAYTF